MPTTQWTGGSRSPSSEGTLQGSGTPLQKKVRVLLQFYITHLLLQEKTSPAIVYSSLAFLNHLWLLPLFTFVTGLFLWRMIFRTLGGVLYDTVLCLVVHKVYLFLSEKQFCSCCPSVQDYGKVGLMTRKKLLCSRTPVRPFLLRTGILGCDLGFPCQDGRWTRPYLREMLVCCRIKYIREI